MRRRDGDRSVLRAAGATADAKLSLPRAGPGAPAGLPGDFPAHAAAPGSSGGARRLQRSSPLKVSVT